MRIGGIQLVALLLLIVVLFPVISVTNDLMAAQNPAETDSVQRRNLEVSVLHAAAICADVPMDSWRTPDPQVRLRLRARTQRVALPQAPCSCSGRRSSPAYRLDLS